MFGTFLRYIPAKTIISFLFRKGGDGKV